MKKTTSFIFYFIIFSLFGFPVFSQTTESGRLLHQAFESVETNPVEALKIAQHIIKSSEKEKQKAEAYLLSAEANYVQGNYDQSLTDAFEARNFSNEKETFEKSTQLVAEILQFLQLNGEADKYLKEINAEKINSKRPSKIKFYVSEADHFFQEKKNDSSILMLQNALQIAKQIKNPFLQLEIHQKLSTNYLSLDDKKRYHTHNQEALALSTTTTRIENNASNTAHQLINHAQDEEFSKVNHQYSCLFWILLGIVFLLILVKLTLKARNKNKLKTYQTLLNYLNQEKINEKEVQTEMISEEIPNENSRQSTILKESENQILHGLKKFESSTRFTHKDMSLSMLASQLNTNTKYLSEVINRHKEKNFNSYINELRINYITQKIKNEPAYLNYKVSYLAETCGFSSHSTFTTVFKSVVGVSPITFVEFVKKEISKEKEIHV